MYNLCYNIDNGKGGLYLPLVYKIDVLDALKEKGYTTYSLRKNKLLSESTIQKLRNNIGVAWDNLETLCELLDCQPADLIAYEKEGAVSEKAD